MKKQNKYNYAEFDKVKKHIEKAFPYLLTRSLMLKDIHSKLGDVLRQAGYSESDVVYIFVEIRKILEKTGEGDKYSSINFYADWVVHSELIGRRAYERLKKLEKIFTEKNTL